MKLISCYVRAFGTIEDKYFEFKDGLNEYLCDNGVGKTTLVAFIRAMLYGLSDSRSRFNDRVNYLPWDSKNCGGNLVIETSGKRYRIERGFAKKSADDIFCLYDEITGFVSEDYGPDIGENLLGVNKEAYEKSIFFEQGALSTKLSDSLNAKIGNLNNVRDDINRFDEAIKHIDATQKIYDKKGKTPGKIPKIEEKIKEGERSQEMIPALEKAIIERKQSIEDKQKRIDEYVEKRDQIAKDIKQAGEFIEKAGRAKVIQEQIASADKELEELKVFFQEKVPAEEEILDMQDRQMSLIEYESRLNEIESRLPTEEKIQFLVDTYGGTNQVSIEFIDGAKRDADLVKALRVAGEKSSFSKENEEILNSYNDFFGDKIPTGEEIKKHIDSAKAITEDKARLSVLSDQRKELEEELVEIKLKTEHSFSIGISTIAIAGIAAICLGIITLITLNQILVSGIIAVFGLLLVTIAFILGTQKRRGIKATKDGKVWKLQDVEEQIANLTEEMGFKEEEINSFISRYYDNDIEDTFGALVEIQTKLGDMDRLSSLYESTKKDTAENVDALAELQMDLYTRLSEYGERYGYNLFENNNETELLTLMKEDIKTYDNYLVDIGEIRKIKPLIEEKRQEVHVFLERYNWTESKTTEQKLLELKSKRDLYAEKEERILKLREELNSYQDIPEFIEDEKTIEKLQDSIKELEVKQNELISEKAKEEEGLTAIRNEIENCEESARQLLALYEEKEEMVKKVEIYMATKEYLRQAKDEFLSFYMKPLKDGMDKYLGKFIGEDVYRDYGISLDMDLSVKVTYKGSTYTNDFLSQGFKDLANVCARLALIDVLYDEEKPPIFLDDPFANLDEGKIEKGKELIKEISKNSQVIYMTCHISRIYGDYISY